MSEEPFVGGRQSIAERGLGSPSEVLQCGGVEKFPWCPIGFAGVEDEVSLKSHNLGHCLGEVFNTHLFSRADIDDVVRVVVLGEKDNCSRQVV